MSENDVPGADPRVALRSACRTIREADAGTDRRTRMAGSRWRVLAHLAPLVGDKFFGWPVDLDSEDLPPTEFDEVVVGQWCHTEQMDTGFWWMNIGGVTIHVLADRDGRPKRVTIDGPGDWAPAAPNCEYDLRWSGDDQIPARSARPAGATR